MTPLLSPHLYGFRNRFFPGGRASLQSFAILLFGLAIFIAIYLISIRTIGYFHSQNELGIILSLKIFEMAWIIFFTMLIFSNMVSGVSALFLSRDNEIICSSPASLKELYLTRYITITLLTSWMMIIFSMPVFSAFGYVFRIPALYYPILALTIISIAATASAIGLAVTIILVNLFPAKRTKDIVVYLSLLFGILLYLVIRLLKPEEMADPDRFPDFIEYLSSLSNPATMYLPPSWASSFLTGYLQDITIDWLLLGLLITTPLVFYFGGEWIMQRWFFPGFSKAQESFGGSHHFKPEKYSPRPLYWFFKKELKSFIRDSAQWSQLFLIGALIVVYLYNFKVLPLDRAPIPAQIIANIIAFANIGLTGFLIASLCARFVFPSIGAEGSGIELIKTSPLSLKQFLLFKYLFYVLPFSLLTAILLIASNHLLRITGPMWWISLVTGLIMTVCVVALAIGFGAKYADFKAENQAAVQGSFGAILFLFVSLTYELAVLLSASIPAYRIVYRWEINMAPTYKTILLSGGVLLAIILVSLSLGFFSIRKGLKQMDRNIV